MCSRSSSALAILANRKFDLVVVCYSVAAQLRFSLAALVRIRWPKTRILLISRHEEVDVDAAVDAISSTDPVSLVRNTKEQLKLIEQAADYSKLQALAALPAKRTLEISS